MDRVLDLPALVVLTFRPEFEAPWSGQAHVSLAALSRRGRLDAPRVTAGERAALDLVWRQHQRYRRLERYLAAAARLSRNA